MSVRLEREGPLAVVTLDSPPLNLFDRPLMEALDGAIGELERDLPRALLFRAEGRAVSGGADVHIFEGLSAQDGHRLWTELLPLVQRVEALPIPIIAAASRSWAVARIAFPCRVRWTSQVSAISTGMVITSTISRAQVKLTPPIVKRWCCASTMSGTLRCEPPSHSKPTFCRMKEKPIAVINGASLGAPRSGR